MLPCRLGPCKLELSWPTSLKLLSNYQADGVNSLLCGHQHLSSLPKKMHEFQLDCCCSGTPAYQAPEICMGLAANVACDVWSFAVVLNEIITGESPRRRGDYRLPLCVSPALVVAPCCSRAFNPEEHSANPVCICACAKGAVLWSRHHLQPSVLPYGTSQTKMQSCSVVLSATVDQ